MSKLTITKKWQQKRAKVACSAHASYSLVDLDSSEEYLDSSGNSDESLDDNFIELDNLDDANIIIEQLRAFLLVGSKKKGALLSMLGILNVQDKEEIRPSEKHTQPPMVDNDENYRDFQDQGDQGDDELEEVLDDEVLSTTEEAHYLAVLYFLHLCLQGQKKIEVSKTVADIVNDLRGRSPSKSLLHDELVSLQVAFYLHSKKFNVDPIMVKNYFKQEILSLLNIESVQGISVRTRLDVIEYCQTFLLKVAQLERFMSKWVDPECKMRTFPDLHCDEKKHVWITHDETTFYVYDRLHSVWSPEGEQPLRKKGLGAAVHISDFLTETIGSLKDDQEEAHVMMVLGANYDGYWDSEKLLKQVKRVVNIFERTHLGYVDVLVASKMNLGLDGLAPKMCKTMWNGSRQSMPKGIQWVLNERGLWRDGMMLECISCKKKEADPNIIDCCVHRLMANQPDFLEQCGQIQQEIESRGHKVIFYPKFHPELNYIEMYWGMAKKYTRSNCEYSLPKTRESIIRAFDSISVEQIHSFTRLSYKWMDAY
ncbi:19386_t:CDS:2 [Cetraspora pellucida]|uniref:19386_t:CDS:1 n=1 Tax=Cetraspora pellucida TaxID=1433469 RepID=A0A9N9P894_9GLOM|nr:19386_t:CDS:2 [Cetraspora pellucida]